VNACNAGRRTEEDAPSEVGRSQTDQPIGVIFALLASSVPRLLAKIRQLPAHAAPFRRYGKSSVGRSEYGRRRSTDRRAGTCCSCEHRKTHPSVVPLANAAELSFSSDCASAARSCRRRNERLIGGGAAYATAARRRRSDLHLTLGGCRELSAR
jgi:hypothetical protein